MEQTKPNRSPGATKHRLMLISGVHHVNDTEVGDFLDEQTASLVGHLLLAMDANNQPEYCGYRLTPVRGQAMGVEPR